MLTRCYGNDNGIPSVKEAQYTDALAEHLEATLAQGEEAPPLPTIEWCPPFIKYSSSIRPRPRPVSTTINTTGIQRWHIYNLPLFYPLSRRRRFA